MTEPFDPHATTPTPAAGEPAALPPTFSPPPIPQTDWSRATWGREPGTTPTPERWFEPVPATPDMPDAPVTPVPPVVPGVPVAPVTPVIPAAIGGIAGPTAFPGWAAEAPSGSAGPTPFVVAGSSVPPVAPTAPTSPMFVPAPTQPVRQERRWGGPGSVIGAALLSAILASGGTYAVLNASGALDRAAAPAPTGTTGTPNASAASLTQPISVVESSAIIDAAAGVGPAVVRITATGTSVDLSGGTIPSTGIGSGVIYDPAGWILTNKHVVTGADGNLVSTLTVELKDGRTFSGTIYGVDTLTDLAIVRIQANGLTAAPIGTSGKLKVGQLAIAIGSPLGTLSNTVTSGIVSATGRSITVENEHLTNLIQTDAAINPGNSGGPLIDAGGNVIGINTAIASGSNGIGFAIPIDIARPIMQQALAGQQLSRPYLGVRYLTIDPQVQKDRNLSVDHGAFVSGSGTGASSAVVAGGPAATGGIQDGDIIVSVNDVAIDHEHPLDAVLAQFSPGQTVAVKVLRGGGEKTLSVVLGTRPAGL